MNFVAPSIFPRSSIIFTSVNSVFDVADHIQKSEMQWKDKLQVH